MVVPRRQFLHGAAAALGLSALPRLACAQLYPSRPITLVVPFPAGGPVDTLARFLAERMRASLGQPLVIENISGAGGSIGVGRVARASPEGYTLIIGITSTHVFNGAMYSLQYDVLNDFEPVALVTDSSQLIVGKKNLPPNDLPELIAWLKANPDKATSGTAGVGSPHHIFGVLFQNATGTRFQFAHYRGAAPATQDMVAGRIDLAIADHHYAAADPRRQHQSLCVHRQEPPAVAARRADGGGGRLTRLPDLDMECDLGAERHAEDDHRKTQRGGRGCARRRRGACAARRAWPLHRAPRIPFRRGAARSAQGRDREVVADHQGGQHPRRLTATHKFAYDILGDERTRSIRATRLLKIAKALGLEVPPALSARGRRGDRMKRRRCRLLADCVAKVVLHW